MENGVSFAAEQPTPSATGELQAAAPNESTPRPDSVQDTALRHACSLGDVDGVKQCIRKGADVNCRDETAWTPLDYGAVFFSMLCPCVRLVGHSLWSAWLGDHPDVLEHLISHGADVRVAHHPVRNCGLRLCLRSTAYFEYLMIHHPGIHLPPALQQDFGGRSRRAHARGCEYWSHRNGASPHPTWRATSTHAHTQAHRHACVHGSWLVDTHSVGRCERNAG